MSNIDKDVLEIKLVQISTTIDDIMKNIVDMKNAAASTEKNLDIVAEQLAQIETKVDFITRHQP